MNDVKPGNQTTEFYVTAATNFVNAVLMILVALNLMSQDDLAMWQGLVGALLLAILPIVTMVVNKEYTKARTAVKLNALLPGAASHRPEAAQ